MKLTFENMGKVKNATIELNDITVLTGINNSGKSTVGKLIYSISTAINLLQENYLLWIKYSSIQEEIYNLNRFLKHDESFEAFSEYRELYNSLRSIVRRESLSTLENEEEIHAIDKELLNRLEDVVREVEHKLHTEEFVNKEKILIVLSNLEEKRNKKFDDPDLIFTLFDRVLQYEFNNHLVSEFDLSQNAFILLEEDNGEKLYLEYENGEISKHKCYFNITRKYGEAIYLDDPFLIENIYFNRFSFSSFFGGQESNELKHRIRLSKKINDLDNPLNVFDEEFQDSKIKNIFSKVLGGELVKERRSYKFYSNDFPKGIAFESLSSGMKTFATLMIIIQNGLLNKSEYVIFDEPETHLHPEWQLKLADLIVAISANYPIRVLVTSHSPYFIEALEIFSTKETNIKNTKFYISEKSKEEPLLNTMRDITNNLEPIYASMYQPLSSLEELRDDIE